MDIVKDVAVSSYTRNTFPAKITPVIEELYWLSQNKRFQKDVDVFRKSWCAWKKGSVTGSKKFSERKDIERQTKEFERIFQNCRLANSRSRQDFRVALTSYIFRNVYATYYDHDPRGLPPVSIRLAEDESYFIIEGVLPSDVTKKDLKELVDLLFVDLREFQKVNNIKRLKKSNSEDSFITSVRLHSAYKEFKDKGSKNPIKDIFADETLLDLDQELEPQKVSQRIRECEAKIVNSYK